MSNKVFTLEIYRNIYRKKAIYTCLVFITAIDNKIQQFTIIICFIFKDTQKKKPELKPGTKDAKPSTEGNLPALYDVPSRHI